MTAVDDKDLQIIRLLEENSRVSLAELAQKVGLASPSVRERLKKLESKEVIKRYSCALDSKKLGLDTTAYVLVTLSEAGKKQQVVDLLEAQPEVLECHHIAAEENFIIKVKTPNISSLEEFLSRILLKPGLISKTRTIIVMSTYFEDRPVPLISS